ncbi:MFS transporter [Alicyclobacillus tolerans]|uniref:MFS transporter n=1 Tax=Alicyclobacillus tolerans TaxID=90970 RepID=UPI001F2284B9|nr:MFS transporter [Alicyclobacillus tolerans]MCF8565445.1 MFS transporter [Alicyclobacillus tolerans]
MEHSRKNSHYKWIALSNTTLGVLMATINQSILIIALPVIFKGLRVNPLQSNQTGLLLWVLLGFNIATTVLLVMFGRLSDMFGRVKLYNLGFLVFTLGSVLASLTWSKGTGGEVELIVFRVIQGIGGGFLFSNSAAILTDAFPQNQRGLALGLNQVAAIGGGIIGLLAGGALAATGHWRWVFLVNVPVGLAGTIWAYIALKEVSKPQAKQRLDIWGNITLTIGLLGIMLGLTYGIMPYGTHSMGWTNPTVLTEIVVGVVFMILFIFIENFSKQPLFNMKLFKIWPFTAGNLASFLGALARGGLQFMLIIWLQGIYLPLHGVSFENTPLIAGLYTIPQMLGFLIAGPVSGILSDRYGPRLFATVGLVVSAVGFYMLNTLPIDFNHWIFWTYLLIIGLGMGLFSSPNNAAIMNALPARYRGVGSGMRATFMNAGQMLSMGMFFSIMIAGLARKLPGAMMTGLTQHGVPVPDAVRISHLPPMASLFAALLGYNPLGNLLQQFGVLGKIPAAQAKVLTGRHFFPSLIGEPFHHGLALALVISTIMLLVAALFSILRGRAFIQNDDVAPAGVSTAVADATSLGATAEVASSVVSERARGRIREGAPFEPDSRPGQAGAQPNSDTEFREALRQFQQSSAMKSAQKEDTLTDAGYREALLAFAKGSKPGMATENQFDDDDYRAALRRLTERPSSSSRDDLGSRDENLRLISNRKP